jgi:hypothetical protein
MAALMPIAEYKTADLELMRLRAASIIGNSPARIR